MENTYLFAWNPKNWVFKDLERNLNELKDFGITTMDWKVQSTKKIKLGDRAYVMRVGDNCRGIFASGIISKLPYKGPYFKNPTKLVSQVNIDFDVFLNPFTESNLSLDEIEKNIPSKQFWTPHQSGIQIREDAAARLGPLWHEFLQKKTRPFSDILVQTLFEGTPYQKVIISYERSEFARALCLLEYGYNCIVCDVNFEIAYGEIGKHFIHVHHINELATLNAGRYTDPITDLRPVCPNCHAILHRKKPAMAVGDLKKIFEERKLSQQYF
ncbi:HNH endonuclease [Mucilaginibacter sp.]|uniref:HNH endonuclease n=1 Tax=Mucilaginibacter sp. TaxID=1882438 RepID=UPI0025F8771A|nr:HNH endonuclease [Mucilaginibacter sp.]